MDPRFAPCSVNHVRIRGLQKTHESVVRQELASAGLGHASTLGEIADACLRVASALESLQVFDGVDLLIDSAPSSASDTAGRPLTDVVCTVAEKKNLVSASTAATTQGGENSLESKVSVRNYLGRAEQIEMQMEAGQQKSSMLRLSAARPRWMGTDALLSADMTKQSVSHIKHSSFVEKLLRAGISAKVGSPSESGGCHELSYKLEQREVCRLTQSTASWSIRLQQGLSLKSALTHTYTRSTLDDVLMPTSGAMLRLATEVAGIAPLPLGDARFCKQTVTTALFAPILPQVRPLWRALI